ncbi:MAG: uracil-DNA glycosylase [Chloroflexota bacterium]
MIELGVGVSSAEQDLADLDAEVLVCTQCSLSLTRTKAVPGEGPIDAELLLIGEGPGYHEDVQGRPFIGPAGRLLDELLESIGLRRDQVYITNVVKCRPPKNRDPAPNEIAACASYLERQIPLLNPKLIVTLGRFSMARWFPGQSIMRIHGQAKRVGDRVIFPMIHPAAALHRSENEAIIREDMLKIPALLRELRAEDAPPASLPGDAREAEDDAPGQLSMF